MSFCPKCGTKLLSSAVNFCPGCGVANTQAFEIARDSEKLETLSQTEAQSAKGEGALLGCLAGWGVSGCLIPLGIILCLTGIGAIIGVPLILAGVLAPFLGPLIGLGRLKGKCPWCGTVVASPGAQGIDCPACKKRIVIKGRKFVKID